MKRLDESLTSLSRARVSVSLEERVMTQVRMAAAQRRAAARLGAHHAWMLLAAALTVVAAEGTGWLSLVRDAVPHRLTGFTHGILQLFFAALRLLESAGQWGQTLAHAVAVGLRQPPVLAAFAVVLLSFGLFMAVRGAGRPASARGL